MSDLGNKEVFARNLKKYIDLSGKDRKELADTWGFPYSTVTDWINGKKYPRIDRIETMANYFGILKSDLVEADPEEYRKQHEFHNANNDIIARITLRMKKDDDFFALIQTINSLDQEQLNSVIAMLAAFIK